MAKFAYKALNKDGKETFGIIEADTQALAINNVRSIGLYPTQIREARKSDEKRARREKGGPGEFYIGGLKSKILAAHLSGARVVILPKKNEKDLRDIPDEIRKQIKVVLVDSMDQVLDAALRRNPQPLQRRSPETSGGEKQGEPLAVPTRSGFPADQPAAIASRR